MSLLQIRPRGVDTGDFLSQILEQRFSFVGPGCDPVRTGESFHHTRKRSQALIGFHPWILLFVALGVGFRLVIPSRDQPTLRLDHTPHHNLVFKSTFSNDDDEVVADGVCAWIADSDHMPADSCVHYFTKRLEKDTPFSPRLRRMMIRLIERMWYSNLWVSELMAIRLLNRLDVGADDMEDKHEWAKLLADVLDSSAGLEGLSIHYWHLLEGLPPVYTTPVASTMKFAGSLVDAEDWEKLEVLMTIAWQTLEHRSGERTKVLGYLKQETLEHLLRRPSAIPRFEGLSESGNLLPVLCSILKSICAQARAQAERLPLEPPPQ